MNVQSPGPATRARFNPVFWIMWLLPGSAVVAGLATLAVALASADRPLPPEYHWEGERLDRDFARAREAASLGLVAGVEMSGGLCRVLLREGSLGAGTLNLQLTHGADAGLDRRLRLTKVAAGDYRMACAPLAAGHWRILLDDDSESWELRGIADGRLEKLELRARHPDGVSP